MPAPIVFLDISGPDAETLRDFYATVFDWRAGDDGALSLPVKSPLAAAFRPDPAGNSLGLVEMVGEAPSVP